MKYPSRLFGIQSISYSIGKQKYIQWQCCCFLIWHFSTKNKKWMCIHFLFLVSFVRRRKMCMSTMWEERYSHPILMRPIKAGHFIETREKQPHVLRLNFAHQRSRQPIRLIDNLCKKASDFHCNLNEFLNYYSWDKLFQTF